MSEAEVGSRTDSRIRQAGTGSRSDREDDTAYLAALAGQGGGGAYGLSGLGTLPSWTPPYALGGDVQAGRDYPFAVTVSPSATNLPRALSRGAGGEGEDAELAVGRKEIYIPEPAVTFNGEPVSVGGNFPGTLSAGGWSTLDAEAEALYVKIKIDASGGETRCTAEWATEPSQGEGEPVARNAVEFSVPIAVGIPNGSWGRPRQVTAGAIHLVDPFLAREDSGSDSDSGGGGARADGKSVDESGGASGDDLEIFGWKEQGDESGATIATSMFRGQNGPIASGSALSGAAVMRTAADGELKYVNTGSVGAAADSGLEFKRGTGGDSPSVELDIAGRDNQTFQICSLKVKVGDGDETEVAKFLGTANVTIEVPEAPSTKQVDVLTGVEIGTTQSDGSATWYYRPSTKKITVLDAPANATPGQDVPIGLKTGDVVTRSEYSEQTHKFTNYTRKGVLADVGGYTSETPDEVFEATAHEDEMDE